MKSIPSEIIFLKKLKFKKYWNSRDLPLEIFRLPNLEEIESTFSFNETNIVNKHRKKGIILKSLEIYDERVMDHDEVT